MSYGPTRGRAWWPSASSRTTRVTRARNPAQSASRTTATGSLSAPSACVSDRMPAMKPPRGAFGAAMLALATALAQASSQQQQPPPPPPTAQAAPAPAQAPAPAPAPQRGRGGQGPGVFPAVQRPPADAET